MNPELMKTLKDWKQRLRIDMDDLSIMMKRKQKEFLHVENLLNVLGSELDEYAQNTEKIVVDCVEGEWDEN